MKILASLVASVFLLILVSDVAPSNPDSEVVQDPTEDNKSAGKKSMEIQSAESRPSIAVITARYSGIKILRPYFTDTGIVWREVATSSGDDRIRIRDRGDFLDVTRVRGNRTVPDRPSGVQDPGSVLPDTYSSVIGPRMPDGNVPYRHAPDGNPPNGNVPYGYAPDGNVPNGNVPNGNIPYGYVPNGNIPYGYVPNGNVPYGYVPDGQVREGGLNRELGKKSPPEGIRTPRPPPKDRHNPGGVSPSATGTHKISPDANLFAGIVNDFAFKMVENMTLESNFVVSPVSIFIALSMLYLAAEGRTKAQLEKALGLNEYSVHGVHLHHGISDLVSMISPTSDEYQLFMANGMFLGKNLTVEEPFKEDVQKYYGATIMNLDFRDSQGSLRAINEWVAKSTMGTIPSLLNSPIPDFTQLILLNAIFFKGVWKTQFPKDATYDGEFSTLDGSEHKVPFMNLLKEKFPIYRSDEHRHSFLKLPYQGDQVSMIIALPFERQGRPMPAINDQILCHMRDAMRSIQLSSVSIPKFRLEHIASLQRTVQQLGVVDLFDYRANLTRMGKAWGLHASRILHEAVVDVNEEGTTAAAVTGVQLEPHSAYSDDFEANHPFAFYIVHEASGLVLFYGKIYDLGEGSHTGNNRRENSQFPPGSRTYQGRPGRKGRDHSASAERQTVK